MSFPEVAVLVVFAHIVATQASKSSDWQTFGLVLVSAASILFVGFVVKSAFDF